MQGKFFFSVRDYQGVILYLLSSISHIFLADYEVHSVVY